MKPVAGRCALHDQNMITLALPLTRMWTAESEKAVTAALIDEYAAAATTAKGMAKAELTTLALTLTLP